MGRIYLHVQHCSALLFQRSGNIKCWPAISGYVAVAQVLKVPQGEYLLQNGANSVLGKQLIALAHKRGIKTINIVRIYLS